MSNQSNLDFDTSTVFGCRGKISALMREPDTETNKEYVDFLLMKIDFIRLSDSIKSSRRMVDELVKASKGRPETI